MGSCSNQPGQPFMKPYSVPKKHFVKQTPEMKIINYSNEADYELILDSKDGLIYTPKIFTKSTESEKDELESEKSLFSKNDIIVLSIIMTAIIALTMFTIYSDNNRLNQIQQYQLAKQAQQYQLDQQNQQYQLAQQNQKLEQYKLAQQYQLARQDQQNELSQQDRQYQLAQQGQQFQQVKLARQYELAKQSQNNSTSTTTTVHFNLGLD